MRIVLDVYGYSQAVFVESKGDSGRDYCELHTCRDTSAAVPNFGNYSVDTFTLAGTRGSLRRWLAKAVEELNRLEGQSEGVGSDAK